MISLSKFKKQHKLSDFQEIDTLDSNNSTAGFYVSKLAARKEDQKCYWLKFPTNDRTNITRLTKEVKFYQNYQEKLVHKNLLEFEGIIPKIDQTPELNPFFAYAEIGKIVIHVPVFSAPPSARCSELRASLKNKISTENLQMFFGCCRYIATQIYEAFKYCHQNEIYIVSLKPDTVSITNSGTVLITDFTESASSTTGQLCFLVTDPVRFGEKGNRSIEIELAEDESQFAFDAKQFDMFTLGTFFFYLIFGVPFYKNNEDDIYQKLIDGKFDDFWLLKLEKVAQECPYFDKLVKEETTLSQVRKIVKLLLLRKTEKDDEDKEKLISWMTSNLPSNKEFVDFFFQCSNFSTDEIKSAVNLSPLQNFKLNCSKAALIEGLVELETKGNWKIIDSKKEKQLTLEYKSASEKIAASLELNFLTESENSITVKLFRITGSWYEYLEVVNKLFSSFEKVK